MKESEDKMSLNNLNPLTMPRSFLQQPQQQASSVSPQEWEYVQSMRRTGWDMNQMPQVQQPNQPQISDPYTDFSNEFSRCSTTVQNKILNDPEFKNAMLECDKKIQAMVEDVIRPQVMQTPDGRIAFERMLAIFRKIKDGYIKEETENLEVLQSFMQDEVVKKRIAELNAAKSMGGNK